MTPNLIKIKIQSIIDGLAQIQVMATWTAPENLPAYLEEIADEVKQLANRITE
jgi:hypothetical protein